jgi:hypothetical protein
MGLIMNKLVIGNEVYYFGDRKKLELAKEYVDKHWMVTVVALADVVISGDKILKCRYPMYYIFDGYFQNRDAQVEWRNYDVDGLYHKAMDEDTFFEGALNGIYKPEDGTAYWANETQISNRSAFQEEPPEGATLVVWRNEKESHGN